MTKEEMAALMQVSVEEIEDMNIYKDDFEDSRYTTNKDDLILTEEQPIPTNIFAAVDYRDIDSAKNFLDQINDNIDGNTPLHFALKYENLDMVKFLYENGADVDIKNNLDQSVIYIARVTNNQEVLNILEYEHTISQDDNLLFPYSLEQIQLIRSNYTYIQIVEKFLEMIIQVKKGYFLEINTNDTPLHNFIFELFQSYYLLNSSCDNPKSLLNEHLDSLLDNCRLRDMLFLFVDMIGFDEAAFRIKLYCGAIVVEDGDIFYGKSNPLDWFDKDSFLDELELSKGEIYQNIKLQGWKSIEEQIDSFKNIPLRDFFHMIISYPQYSDIKNYFYLNRLHSTWYIKDNYSNESDEKLKLFNSYWKKIDELIEFYENNIEKIEYTITKD